MSNHIVLRQSPDWLTFDMQETRAFCTKLGFAADMIIEFAALWDQSMRLSFLEYRHAMKLIALDTVRACRNAEIIPYEEFLAGALDPDGLYYFIDDDDWVSPHLFEVLQGVDHDELCLWGSIYIGQMYSDTPYIKVRDPAVLPRALDGKTVYTNNYSLRASAIERVGKTAILEHFDAQTLVDEGEIQVATLDQYLSAANKHPCCTMAILFNMKSDHYRQNMRDLLAAHTDDIEGSALPDPIAWIEATRRRLIEINRRAIG